MAKLSATTLLLVFAAWYAFNASYNVYTQKSKAIFALFPLFVAATQLMVGLSYSLPLWLLGARKAPRMTLSDLVMFLPIVLLNTIGHVSAVTAMFEKGGGSFTHVIKASEPVVSGKIGNALYCTARFLLLRCMSIVILGVFINGAIPKPLTALSLLPITYGVAYASTLGNLSVATMSKELFTKTAVLAMISNIAFALRSIMRKNLSEDYKNRTGLKDPANDHAVTTAFSFLLSAALALYMEKFEVISSAYNSVADKNDMLMVLAVGGFSFYLYNEMQNLVLSSLGPVPTAVGNTLKRVVIFVALYFCIEGTYIQYCLLVIFTI